MKTVSFDSWWYWQVIFVEKFFRTPLVYEKTVVVLSVCDIRKNLPKGLRLAYKLFETIRLSFLWYDFTIMFFLSYFLAYLYVFVVVFFSPNRKSDGWANWRLALLWSLSPQFVYWSTSSFQSLGKNNIRQGMRNYTNATRQELEA